jgi:hypothetical protein
MLGAEAEDNLTWLAEHFTVELERRRTGERNLWYLELYRPHENQELGGTRFDGADLGQLLALARESAATPFGDRLPECDWLRLYQTAARTGKPAGQLLQQGLQQGVRELLDRIDAEG